MIEQYTGQKASMHIAIKDDITITLKTHESFIEIGPAYITIEGTPLVLINSGGSPAPLTAQPESPQEPKEADDRKPPEALTKASAKTPPQPGAPPGLVSEAFSPQAAALQQAAKTGAAFCAVCEA